ncbi:MAG: divergent polysaccharide deacetylase family protein [Treponema sp.]|jgi:polysaccharide deacetylase 2 family uncharacterized protein YibQ/cell division protein FtsL|nr:divergent polysaccharide deacetylase family protein [Treponema sp.]
MKKTEKVTKKPASNKKTAGNTRKKTVKTTKIAKKRISKVKKDVLRAFQMVSVLVVFSLLVSLTIIFIYSKTVSDDEMPLESVITNTPPVTDDLSTSVVSVSVQHPSQTSAPSGAAAGERSNIKPDTGTAFSQPAANNIPAANTVSPVNSTAVSTQKPPAFMGTVVFVIDDAGNNLHELEPFLKLPSPLTIAVLPALPYSAEAARRIRAAGKEVMLHQPMEALGGQNPGPGAIYNSMSADEVRAVLSRNIAEVGPVAGINNHQGSKVTMNREAMETILAFCGEHGLYFLDSRTTAETAAPAAAKMLGMKIAERDVFIDNEQDRESMLRYITGGLERAQRNGSAVMIGHAWSPALAPLLAEQFQILTRQGYIIKTASDMINGN